MYVAAVAAKVAAHLRDADKVQEVAVEADSFWSRKYVSVECIDLRLEVRLHIRDIFFHVVDEYDRACPTCPTFLQRCGPLCLGVQDRKPAQATCRQLCGSNVAQVGVARR